MNKCRGCICKSNMVEFYCDLQDVALSTIVGLFAHRKEEEAMDENKAIRVLDNLSTLAAIIAIVTEAGKKVLALIRA